MDPSKAPEWTFRKIQLKYHAVSRFFAQHSAHNIPTYRKHAPVVLRPAPRSGQSQLYPPAFAVSSHELRCIAHLSPTASASLGDRCVTLDDRSACGVRRVLEPLQRDISWPAGSCEGAEGGWGRRQPAGGVLAGEPRPRCIRGKFYGTENLVRICPASMQTVKPHEHVSISNTGSTPLDYCT